MNNGILEWVRRMVGLEDSSASCVGIEKDYLGAELVSIEYVWFVFAASSNSLDDEFTQFVFSQHKNVQYLLYLG